MRLALLLGMVGILAVAAGISTSAPIPNAELTPPIPSRQNLFGIPYVIEAPSEPAEMPVSVQLYVSEDRGEKWTLALMADPKQSQFDFRAPRDGEFWFLIRTLDRMNRVRPELGGPPELRVIVDTMPPTMKLSATRGESGEIEATWQALDQNLVLESVRLEYQAGTGQEWRPVALDPSKFTGTGLTRTGTVRWWPANTSDTIQIRAEIRDIAGNSARSEIAVDRARQSDVLRPVPEAASPQPRDSMAGTSSIWPGRPTDVPLGSSPTPANPERFTSSRTEPTLQPVPAAAGSTQQPALDSVLTGRPMPVSPPVQNQFASTGVPTPAGAVNGPSFGSADALPAGERPRLVNSKSFEMEYEVESVGPSGILKVEMWSTRDGGRSWQSAGRDDDNRSPIRINVDGEGLYGFRISVQSGNGLGGAPPQSGDRPEVWVAVDLTPPTAKLIAAEQGTGEQAHELAIRWEASDGSLSQRPVSLSFAAQQQGPWYTIASGLQNTGLYVWQIDSRVPEQMYLRLEVRDEGGNLSISETAQPVVLQRLRPEARIRGVRPVGETAATPPQGYAR